MRITRGLGCLRLELPHWRSVANNNTTTVDWTDPPCREKKAMRTSLCLRTRHPTWARTPPKFQQCPSPLDAALCEVWGL